jgi:hypothetical protein
MPPAGRIEQAADWFWSAAGGRSKFGRPPDLDRAVALALPLGVCRMPRLSTAKVAAVLKRTGTLPWSVPADRPLRACLVADIGVGLVFLDGDDPADEQRYSLAHEVAHFLAHYLEPRQRALDALGSTVVAVLDRQRPPTVAERLSSALRDVPLEPFRHAMSRTAEGRAAHVRTETMEAEADRLALEILVPTHEFRSRTNPDATAIAIEFGIPERAVHELPLWYGRRSEGVIEIFRKKPA